ncbi:MULTISPECIES: hypothetical protein [Pseudanabaena]|uniref:Glycosyltransferase RgtA/B/C/D-like domain-containing protein n=2 Tax=Pseudanabaena TaxID=1152 RepID=L8MUW7_9CYAN|nr:MULTISPECIES: hypothetical protein [Pseudanabaena]ELS30614.1 hypothetical protein Pse7429DRAFT_4315 [Pseudanabaena biceps PCC 7429]MDG3497114.1 hypothetical protein [Pseudanabaena catenata USMAC16]
MQCPLCESTQFERYGKIPNGNFKYRCEICNNIFTDPEKDSLASLDINLLRSADKRLIERKLIKFQYIFSKLIFGSQSRIINRYPMNQLGKIIEERFTKNDDEHQSPSVKHPIFSGINHQFLYGFCLISLCTAIAFGLSYSISNNFEERYFSMFYAQASAFLQGRIDLGVDWTHDLISFEGKEYLGIAPLNGFLMVPFVFFFKEKFTETWFSNILYTILIIVQFIFVERFSAHRNKWQRSLLFIFLALGTMILPCAVISTSWFNAVLSSCIFHSLAWLTLFYAKNLRQDFIGITFLAIAATGRYHLAIIFPIFIAKAWLSRYRGNFKALIALCIPVVMYVIFVLWWNWVRFGYPFSVGYDRITGAAFFAANIEKYGMHNLVYVLPNIYHGIIGFPKLIVQFPFFQIDDLGNGTLAVSPLFIYIFSTKNLRSSSQNLAWLCMAIIAVPVLSYVSTGWRQFGYRYFLDYLPYASFLLLKTKFNVIRPVPLFCIAISIWFNIIGPIIFLKPEKFGM